MALGDGFWLPLDGGSTSTTSDRWEVVVTGSPAEAVTTEDGTDWLYTRVTDEET